MQTGNFHFPQSGAEWVPTVYSEVNFVCFLTYVSNFAFSTEMIEELQTIPTVEHWQPPNLLLAHLNIQNVHPQATTKTGVSWSVPSIPCNIPGCQRCAHGLGGWAFRWRSNCWTPQCAIGDPQAPANRMDAERRCREATWPEGYLQPPRPRLP